jgi:acetyl esterase/lipase
MSLYRGMDRAALDAAYNNSHAVADSAQFLARWEEASAALRRAMPQHLDLRYAAAERARIDYFAAGARNAPTLLFIHGGYWQRNAKEMFGFIAEGPLARGVNVALIGYTLAPEARLDAIVGECRTGAAWLSRHLAGLGADPRRLYLSGWSAGGHLTAMLMDMPAVQGALAISGIYDLEPIRLSYLNEKLRLDEREAERNSPIRHLPLQAPPLLVAVGGDELPELYRQSESYAAAWRAEGRSGTFLPLPNRHHYTILEELARPDGALCEALTTMVASAPLR